MTIFQTIDVKLECTNAAGLRMISIIICSKTHISSTTTLARMRNDPSAIYHWPGRLDIHLTHFTFALNCNGLSWIDEQWQTKDNN